MLYCMNECHKASNFSGIIFLTAIDLKNLLDSKGNTLVKLLNVSKVCSPLTVKILLFHMRWENID